MALITLLHTISHEPVEIATYGEGFLDASTDIEVADAISIFFRGSGSLTTNVRVRNMIERIPSTVGVGSLEAEAIAISGVPIQTGGYGVLDTHVYTPQQLRLRTRGVGRLHAELRSRSDAIFRPTVRHIYRFSNEDESRVIDIPIHGSAYEWTSTQDLVQGYSAVVGKNYGVDLSTQMKAFAVETIRFLITSNNPNTLNDYWRNLRGHAFEIGRGRLWVRDVSGRRWAEARLEAMPEIDLGRSRHIMPLVMQFTRLTDWYEEYPREEVSIPSSGGVAEAIVFNPGTAPTTGTFVLSGSFVNPTLTIGDEQMTVNVSSTGTLIVNTETMRVFLNGSEVSHLTHTPATQVGFPLLRHNDNLIRWQSVSGVFTAGYSFHPAYH